MEGKSKKITLPDGEVKAKLRPSFTGKYDGTVFLTAELEVNGRLIKVLPIRVTVEVFHNAVATTRPVEKGAKFTAENVSLARLPTSKMTRGCFNQLGYVLGRTAALQLPAGTVIRVSDINDPPAIRHGQTVQGIMRRGNVELAVQVRAVEDGKAGETIKVENTDSHKLLRGKILDEKTVLLGQEEAKQ
jgi:flagella basal body P-ring formation protein FlgA